MKRKYYRKKKKRGKSISCARHNTYRTSAIITLAVIVAGALCYINLKDTTIETEKIKDTVSICGCTAAGLGLICTAYKAYKKRRYLKSDIYRIDRMSGVEFEEFLKCFFEKKGYQVKNTPGSGDYGVDLICTKTLSGKLIPREKEIMAVQAKRYSGTVGISAVQQLIGGMHYYDCNKGMVITNSAFSRNAYNLADKSNVVLIDRDSLKKELKHLSNSK